MGAVNYRTSEYITLGIEPYDSANMENYVINNPEEFDSLSSEIINDPEKLNTWVNDYIRDLYDADLANAQSIINDYHFQYFDVSLEYGYHEGFSLDISPDFSFYSDDDKMEALEEAKELKEMLTKLAGVGMVACYPGWSTGYEDYNGTLKEIDNAYETIVKAIEDEPEYTESAILRVNVLEAASAYSAKLSQFLDGQNPEVVKWVKKALNNIFLGIKNDFDGYQEGKRPTIKNYGEYKVFKMTIQAVSDVKKDSNDVKGKWNFHDPVKDYCASLGKIISKKIDGNSYQCVVYNHKENLENVWASEFEKLTSQAVYPMVGCYSTGIGGSYKNLSKDIPGTTYSIVVSIPVLEADKKTYENPYMSNHGTVYVFSNDHHSNKDGSDTFTVEYDMADGEFVIREYTEDSADRFTIIYKGRNHMKAFDELVKTFGKNTSVGEVESILKSKGLKLQHSWWFNPYTD